VRELVEIGLEPRLADAGLAGEQDDGGRSGKRVAQQPQRDFPTDQSPMLHQSGLSFIRGR
jgi:hypothetical protein